MDLKIKPLELFGILLLTFSAQGQVKRPDLLSGKFQNMNFLTFVKMVELSTRYHFFYDTSDVSTIVVNVTLNNAHLNSVLDHLFENTSLKYCVDNHFNVFITNGFVIQLKLPFDFLGGKRIITYPENGNNNPSFVQKRTFSHPEISVENRLYEIGIKTNNISHGFVNLAGYLKDSETGEIIKGGLVSIPKLDIQVSSDQFGYYSINLPVGRHTLSIQALGMYDTKRQVMLFSDGRLNINLKERVMSLKEVVIQSNMEGNVRSTMMGSQRVDIASIRQIPGVFGQPDILRVVMNIPGVKTVGEASTGLNVRGGATDQNLILFNDETIYNPSHLFGFFSAFNPDVIRDVTLYKSSIPERYGGRISSVLEINSLNGDEKKIKGTAGISPITTQLSLQGPIIPGKTTFILGARTTYSNWIFHILPATYNKSKAGFQDFSLHLNEKIDDKNFLYFNGYYSSDNFNLNNDTSYNYHNKNGNLQWKHTFNNRFYGVLTSGIDHYDYQVSSGQNPFDAFRLGFWINQDNLKSDFNYFLNNKHNLDFGFSIIKYKILPGEYNPIGSKSLIISDTVEQNNALESALYFGDHYTINSKISLNVGIRYSLYDFLGPQKVFSYPPKLPRQPNNIEDTLNYSNGKSIKKYGGPEFRISGRYTITENSALKFSFNSLRQYIHMLSNTSTISPTDIWQLSNTYISPQLGEQISLGYYNNFGSNSIEGSIEGYYKWFSHYLDYKSGAQLIMNHHIETDIINTNGKAYGIEFLIKKTSGKLNGWLSYTYSRSFLVENDPLAGELVNNGKQYPSTFDQPHNLNLIGNYRFSHRFSISFNLVYSTGRPITLPIAEYDYAGSVRVLYSNRNQYRIPDYFRSDISMNIDGNARIHQFIHNSWTIGVYNWTGRKNAYSVYYISDGGRLKGYKLSIFGSAIPFLTYNFKF